MSPFNNCRCLHARSSDLSKSIRHALDYLCQDLIIDGGVQRKHASRPNMDAVVQAGKMEAMGRFRFGMSPFGSSGSLVK